MQTTRNNVAKTNEKLAKRNGKKPLPLAPVSYDDTLNVGEILGALRALTNGDFTVRLPLTYTGAPGEVARAFNTAVQLNERLMIELTRMNSVVGKDGRLSQRAQIGSA